MTSLLTWTRVVRWLRAILRAAGVSLDLNIVQAYETATILVQQGWPDAAQFWRHMLAKHGVNIKTFAESISGEPTRDGTLYRQESFGGRMRVRGGRIDTAEQAHAMKQIWNKKGLISGA